MVARLKRKRSKSQIQSLNEESVVSDILLEPINIPEFWINLGLPAVKLEYCDGSGWYPLASESWVTANAPGTMTGITAGTGLTGGTITSSGTIGLASVGITAGSYNWPSSLNINAQGQVTGASSGSQPITSIISSSGLTINTSAGQSLINIFNTGVTPGTYNWPAGFSVNAIGQLTSVTASGSLPINRLAGYPASTSYFLRGDGSWASPTSSSIDINTGTTGQLSISRLNGYPGLSNAFLRGDGTWILPYINNLNINGTVSFLSYGLTTSGNVNATTGSLIGNNLAAHSSSMINVQNPISLTNSGYQCYIHPNSNYLNLRTANTYNSAYSTIFECNNLGETSSLVMNGDYMQFINPLDTLGFIFTDEDNSTMTSYVAYINGSGQFISSSKEQKHSLQRKEHKDYLDRLNQLNVYSYGLKYDILEDDSPQKKERKARKANEIQVGLIAEEVLEFFDNATNVYKPLDETQQTNHKHTPSLAINYNKLLCYTILAIQELTNRVAFLEKKDAK